MLIPKLNSEIRDLKIAINERDTIAENERIRDKNLGPQCPDRNPDISISSHRFDTNNNPNDQTYISCLYFKDYNLKVQIPYTNGNIDGVRLDHLQYKECGGRVLTSRRIYRNGQRVFAWSYGCNTKTGNVYKRSMTSYSNGKKTNVTHWHSNGVKEGYTDYKPNGRPDITYVYRRDGSLAFCKQYDSNGNSRPCK